MINLSNKVAKRYHINWNELEERSGDFWKIDIVMLGRVPMLFIVHEQTLFTLVRRKSEFKSLEDIAEEIKFCCPWYKNDTEFSLGKNGNRKILGSINEMKRMTAEFYFADDINDMELLINTSLFSYLSPGKYTYSKPCKAVLKYLGVTADYKTFKATLDKVLKA